MPKSERSVRILALLYWHSYAMNAEIRTIEWTERSEIQTSLFERSIVRISALFWFRMFGFQHSTVCSFQVTQFNFFQMYVSALTTAVYLGLTGLLWYNFWKCWRSGKTFKKVLKNNLISLLFPTRRRGLIEPQHDFTRATDYVYIFYILYYSKCPNSKLVWYSNTGSHLFSKPSGIRTHGTS